jgi:hypothetical protein
VNTQSVNPLIIWRLTDGKPGHQNQSLGLVNALKRKLPCASYDIPVKGRLQPIFDLFSTTWPAGRGLPFPDLIIGAGHRTHMHMLAAKKVYGGKTIVLMQPSLPLSLFDLSLIPEHDRYKGKGSVLETRGVLNQIQAKGEHKKEHGLIMIGGPSKHCGWDNTALLSQITQLCKQNPHIQYVLTTSRRTPLDFVTLLSTLTLSNLDFMAFEETGTDWVAEKLANCFSAWITEDSVSMVYEALTAQTAVGLLNLPIKKENRVSRGMNQLIDDGLIVRFDSLGLYKKNMLPVAGFIESDRCANWILTRWLEPAHKLAPQLLPQHG